MRAVTRRLESMKLSDFDGENVKNAVSLIKGAMGLLANNDALSADMVDITFRIMKTSSTDEFNTHVNLMRSNHDLGVMRMDMSHLMFNLQKKYNELSLNGEWELGASTGQESVFSCFSCGAEDHMWRQCPNLDETRVQQVLQRLSQGSNASNQSTTRGPRGRRGGRGGRTGGSRPNVFRTPPQSGQPHVRRRGPLIERWCGTCGVWGSHASAQHTQAESAQVVVPSDQTAVSFITQLAPTSTPAADTVIKVTPSTTSDGVDPSSPFDDNSLTERDT